MNTKNDPEQHLTRELRHQEFEQAMRGGADDWEAHLSYESLFRKANRMRRVTPVSRRDIEDR